MLPFRAEVDLGAIVIKRCFLHSAKLLHYWSLTIRLLVSYPGHSLGEFYPSAEICRCILYPQLTEPEFVYIYIYIYIYILRERERGGEGGSKERDWYRKMQDTFKLPTFSDKISAFFATVTGIVLTNWFSIFV